MGARVFCRRPPQLRQQTEMLRRSLLAPAMPAVIPGGRMGSPPGSPASWELRRQQEALNGMATCNRRLQDGKARHAGFASELRNFARHMQIET